MKRRLLDLLTLLSLLLCVAVAALWVRSDFVRDFVVVSGSADSVILNSLVGQFYVAEFPQWSVLALAAVVPVVRVLGRRRRRRRIAAGLCPRHRRAPWRVARISVGVGA